MLLSSYSRQIAKQEEKNTGRASSLPYAETKGINATSSSVPTALHETPVPEAKAVVDRQASSSRLVSRSSERVEQQPAVLAASLESNHKRVIGVSDQALPRSSSLQPVTLSRPQSLFAPHLPVRQTEPADAHRQHAAATHVQRVYRGHAVRRQHPRPVKQHVSSTLSQSRAAMSTPDQPDQALSQLSAVQLQPSDSMQTAGVMNGSLLVVCVVPDA